MMLRTRAASSTGCGTRSARRTSPVTRGASSLGPFSPPSIGAVRCWLGHQEGRCTHNPGAGRRRLERNDRLHPDDRLCTPGGECTAGGGVHIVAVHGQLDDIDREARLELFREGRITSVSAPRVLDEGIDVPEADLGNNRRRQPQPSADDPAAWACDPTQGRREVGPVRHSLCLGHGRGSGRRRGPGAPVRDFRTPAAAVDRFTLPGERLELLQSLCTLAS